MTYFSHVFPLTVFESCLESVVHSFNQSFLNQHLTNGIPIPWTALKQLAFAHAGVCTRWSVHTHYQPLDSSVSLLYPFAHPHSRGISICNLSFYFFTCSLFSKKHGPQADAVLNSGGENTFQIQQKKSLLWWDFKWAETGKEPHVKLKSVA